jgi:phage tail-like protein
MIPEEFKTQIFKTPQQWGSGLLYRLDVQEKGGITLYSTPAFTQWIIQVGNGINNPAGLAIDECGQVYLVDPDTKSKICRLYRYDYRTQNLEQLSYIVDHNSDQKKAQCPPRMLLDKYTLWINDIVNQRVLAFSRENYQIKYIINKLNGNGELIEPVDIGLDEYGHLYILSGKPNNYQIVKYDIDGNFINRFELNLGEAVGLAHGNKNELYIIDRKNKQLLKYTEEDSKLVLNLTVDLSNILEDFQRSGIVIDRKGNIFISDGSKGLIYQLDPDGSYIGIVPGFTGIVQGLAIDSKGDLYISSNKGICQLSAQNTFTKEAGTYYSKTLDSGILGCRWHRIALEADIPPKTILEIFYSSSDDSELKDKIDNEIKAEKISIQEKARFIDEQLNWSEPEKNPKDMLFRGKKGQYLWLKLKLSTFDETIKPTITQMRIYYPRISYLRYLPAIYQEDETSKEFLERFLSIFETANHDLETEIRRIYEYFDPCTVPQNFLNWLASWLNVALEEDWPEEKKRQFIREASTLYKFKGTQSSIRKLIEIYTGKEPLILEHSKIGKPVILGRTFILGVNSLLVQTPIRGFRLGDDSILGRVALRGTDIMESLEDPFLPFAHRFTIILDLSTEEVTRYEKGLRGIIDEEKPAHTEYNVRFLSNIESVGTYLGLNTRLDYYKPIQIGVASTIGSGMVIMEGEHGGRVERHGRVGYDTELI